MTLREFVKTLARDEVAQICHDHDLYESTGVTGDTVLRRRTREWLDTYIPGMSGSMGIVIWLKECAFECFRRAAYDRIEL